MSDSIDLFDMEAFPPDFSRSAQPTEEDRARFEKWCADRDAGRARKIENEKKRKRVLARPINAEDIETQSNHLHYVPYAGHVCMMHYTKARGGVTGEYGKFKFYTEGEYVWVGAHQFALALKLGNYQMGRCRLSDLFGFDAAHASKAICLGGRCCLPEHLFKRKSEPNRSWDSAKDYSLDGMKGYRSENQLRGMVSRLQLPISAWPAPLPDFLEIL